MAYAVLRDRVSGGIYIHINVHTDHKCDDYINRLCAKQMLTTAGQLSAKYGDCPVILSGDYNADETTGTYAYLNNPSNGFVDAKYLTDIRSNASSCAGYGDSFKDYYTVVIDHIFVSSGNVGVYSHEILEDRYVSDHSAVKVKLRLNDMPVLDGITLDGKQVENFDRNLYGYDITAESTNLSLGLHTDKGNTISLNGVAQNIDAQGYCSVPLELEEGGNICRICVVNAAGVRTEYALDIYCNYGEPVIFVSEICSSRAGRYFSVTNLGTCNVSIRDYEFYWGEAREDGTTDWGSPFEIDWERTRLSQIKVGQTLVFWVTDSGDPEKFDQYYGTELAEMELIYGSLAAGSQKQQGVRIADRSGNTISESSCNGLLALDDGTVYKFGYVVGEIAATASDAERVEYATPDYYERFVGENYRDAYSRLEAEEKDSSNILGVEQTIIPEDAAGNQNLNATAAESWAFYANVDFGSGKYGADRAVLYGACRESNCAGEVEIWIDGSKEGDLSGATLVGVVATFGTQDDWLLFREYECRLNQPVIGVHNVTLVMRPTLSNTINLDYFTFVAFEPGQEIERVESVDCAVNGLPITDETLLKIARDENTCYLTVDVVCTPLDAAMSVGYFSSDEKVAQIDEKTGEITCVGSGEVTFTMVIYSNMTAFSQYYYAVEIQCVTDAYDYIQGEWATDINNSNSKPARYEGAEGMSEYCDLQGNNYLSGIIADTQVTYRQVNFGEEGCAGVIFNFAVKESNSLGLVEIYVANEDGTLRKIGYCDVNTGTGSGWDVYRTFTGIVEDGSLVGVHDVVLKFVVDEGKKYVGNLDYFQFVPGNFAVEAVERLINAIGTEIYLGTEAAIREAREAYDALSGNEKTQVENLDSLTAAEAKLERLQQAIGQKPDQNTEPTEQTALVTGGEPMGKSLAVWIFGGIVLTALVGIAYLRKRK